MEKSTKQRLAEHGYTLGERVATYRRHIIGPDGVSIGAMDVRAANELLAALDRDRHGATAQGVLL